MSGGSNRSAGDAQLRRDAEELYRAVSELVRVYQFRDRQRICYYDISASQCYALGSLLSAGVLTQGDLASRLHLDKSTTSRLVDSLEAKGYVRRRPSRGDARALKLQVTPKGRDLHRRIEVDLVDGMKALIEDLDPDVRQATARLVSQLARAATTRFEGHTPR